MLATILQVGGDSALYGLLLLLHILSSIVGFGGVFLNGLYAQQSMQRRGLEGVAINQANWVVSKVAEVFIYLTFVFGVLMVLAAENDSIGFGDTWIWLSMVVYLVGIGISHGLLYPSVRRAHALAEELAKTEGPPPGAQGPPPQVVELEALGKKIGTADMALKLALVVILYLMIWKPGFP